MPEPAPGTAGPVKDGILAHTLVILTAPAESVAGMVVVQDNN